MEMKKRVQDCTTTTATHVPWFVKRDAAMRGHDKTRRHIQESLFALLYVYDILFFANRSSPSPLDDDDDDNNNSIEQSHLCLTLVPSSTTSSSSVPVQLAGQNFSGGELRISSIH